MKCCAQQHFNLKVLVNLQGHVLSPSYNNNNYRLRQPFGWQCWCANRLCFGWGNPSQAQIGCLSCSAAVNSSKQVISIKRPVGHLHPQRDLPLVWVYKICNRDNHPAIHPDSFSIRWGTSCNYDFIARPHQRDKPVSGKNEHLQSIQFAERAGHWMPHTS